MDTHPWWSFNASCHLCMVISLMQCWYELHQMVCMNSINKTSVHKWHNALNNHQGWVSIVNQLVWTAYNWLPVCTNDMMHSMEYPCSHSSSWPQTIEPVGRQWINSIARVHNWVDALNDHQGWVSAYCEQVGMNCIKLIANEAMHWIAIQSECPFSCNNWTSWQAVHQINCQGAQMHKCTEWPPRVVTHSVTTIEPVGKQCLI